MHIFHVYYTGDQNLIKLTNQCSLVDAEYSGFHLQDKDSYQ